MSKPVIKIGKDGQKLAVITPSLLCNYDCSYCRIKAKTRAADEHEMTDWLEAMIRIGSPVAHIAGGEPTVLNGFEQFALEYPGSLRMTTNLWKHPSKWNIDFWGKFEYLTISFHPEHTSFEDFRDRAKYLTEMFSNDDESPRLACTIVAHPKLLNDIERWVNELKAAGVNARGQYFNAPAGSELRTYSDDQLKKLKDFNIPMSSGTAGQEELDAPTLKLCDAGMYYTHINRRGEARRCSRDQTKLGNIFDGSFSWFKEEQKCATPCTEACDHTFSTFTVLEKLKPADPDAVPVFKELLIDKAAEEASSGWSGNGKSRILFEDGKIKIDRQGGPMDRQCVQVIHTNPGRAYEFRGKVIDASHEFVLRINGSTVLKRKTRGKFKCTFTATGQETTVEVLPTADWNASATLESLSLALSIPSSKAKTLSVTTG